MPVAYHISTEHHLLYLAGFGSTTGGDYISILDTAIDDPLWQPDLNSIVDMRAITEHIIDLDDIRKMVLRDTTLIREGVMGNYQNAYIVRNETDRSIGLLYDTLIVSNAPASLIFESKVFYSLDPALAWLGLSGVGEKIHGVAEQLVQQLFKSSEG